jgi:hypothetical protein
MTKRAAWEDELAEAIYQDACEVFERFTKAHGHEHITGFAACTVDDCCPPYYMGATLESGFGPAGKVDDDGDPAGWDDLSPADWCWSDDNQRYRADKVKYSIDGEGWEPNKKVLDAMCRGLEKFNSSGRFQGKLPREQMLIVLFVNDPSCPEWALEFAERINPKPASDWFKKVYPYGDGENAEDEDDDE